MGIVTTFQALHTYLHIVLTGLVFSAFSILLKERLFNVYSISQILIILSGDVSFT